MTKREFLGRCYNEIYHRHRALFNVLVVSVLIVWTAGSYLDWNFVSVRRAFDYLLDYHPPWLTPDTLGIGRRLSQRLVKLHHRLQRCIEAKHSLGLKDLMELQAVLMQLDPSVGLDTVYRYDDGFDIIQSGQLPITSLVCPEMYLGSHAHLGWAVQNCSTNFTINDLVTVIADMRQMRTTSGTVPQAMDQLTADFNSAYPGINIIAITDQMWELNVPSSSNVIAAKSWNEAIDMVTTPYVLIAQSIFRFSKGSSSLERLLRVLTEVPSIAAVGGALRNSTAHWEVGCFQTSLQNYVLEYQKGYHRSQNECMLCDYIDGPFIASARLLQKYTLDQSLENTVLFQDFFLNVSHSGPWSSLLCPDVMFYGHGQMIGNGHVLPRAFWMDFARKWELNRILILSEFSQLLHKFSCDDLGISCRAKIRSTSSFTIPVCCQEELGSALKLWDDFCQQYNLKYQLDSGCALGAVKMADFIPWDIDVDGGYHETNYSFLRSMAPYFLLNGLNLTGFQDPKCCDKSNPNGLRGSYLQLWTPSMKMEMWADWKYPRDEFLWQNADGAVSDTKMELHGVWVKGPPNPGYYARKRYGPECLKHAQSWSQTGKKNSMQPYEAGHFRNCKNPWHHSCLDRFPTDGNIAYLVPN